MRVTDPPRCAVRTDREIDLLPPRAAGLDRKTRRTPWRLGLRSVTNGRRAPGFLKTATAGAFASATMLDSAARRCARSLGGDSRDNGRRRNGAEPAAAPERVAAELDETRFLCRSSGEVSRRITARAAFARLTTFLTLACLACLACFFTIVFVTPATAPTALMFVVTLAVAVAGCGPALFAVTSAVLMYCAPSAAARRCEHVNVSDAPPRTA